MTSGSEVVPVRPLTALDLLFDEPARAGDELATLVRERGLLEAMPEGAPRLGAAAARLVAGSVVQAIESVLATFAVEGMLTTAWSALEQVQQAITATRADGGARTVQLLEHRVVSHHTPRIDLLVDEVPLSLLELVLDASFVVNGCDLVVRAGELSEVVPGHIGAEAALSTGSMKILEHRVEHLDLSRLFAGVTTDR